MVYKTIFVDTNIVLDILDSSRKGNAVALKLVKSIIINKIKIVISEDMLTTIFYINSDKRRVLEFFEIINKRWIVLPFGKSLINKAIDISLKKNQDLEDTLQCLCAKENKCIALITNDKNFPDCGIEVYTPEEFLKCQD